MEYGSQNDGYEAGGYKRLLEDEVVVGGVLEVEGGKKIDETTKEASRKRREIKSKMFFS